MNFAQFITRIIPSESFVANQIAFDTRSALSLSSGEQNKAIISFGRKFSDFGFHFTFDLNASQTVTESKNTRGDAFFVLQYLKIYPAWVDYAANTMRAFQMQINDDSLNRIYFDTAVHGFTIVNRENTPIWFPNQIIVLPGNTWSITLNELSQNDQVVKILAMGTYVRA